MHEELLREARKLAQKKLINTYGKISHFSVNTVKDTIDKKVSDKIDTIKQQINFLENSLEGTFKGELSTKSRETIKKQIENFNGLND